MKYSFLATASARVFTMMVLPVLVNAQSSVLEEVTVTARKIEESLMDVPISILVVSGDTVQEGNIAKLENLAPTLPNFHHSEAVSGNDQVFIRGIGSGINFGFENSVGQVFDGIFFGRARYGRSLFMDLEQIEILKGPQGALIGKNTSAGAINIRGARPTEEFEAYIVPTWEFEGDEGPTVEGALSGPLSERLRGRVAFRYEDRDGFVKNLTRNTTEMQREEAAIRIQLESNLTDSLNARILYQFSDQTREGRPREVANCTPALANLLNSLGDDCQWNFTNSGIYLQNGVEQESATDTESHLAGLTLDWETAFGTLTSITAFSRYEVKDAWDSDTIAPEGVSLLINEEYEQWSQEIRITSSGENVLDYTAGAYFQFVDQKTRFGINFNFMGPAPLPVLPPFLRATSNRHTDQESDTQAVFAQVTWHAHSQLDLTAGFRFTHEDKEARHLLFPTVLYTDTPTFVPGGPAGNTHDVSGDRTENQFTPNGTIQWRPTDTTMLYANISKGFKGGGFDHQSGAAQAEAEQSFEFGDESVVAYEVGGKFEFPEARARLSVSAFRSEFDDLQVSSLVPGGALVFRVQNAASAVTQGIELDGKWRPMDNLDINVAAAYLDAEYDEYTTAPCNDLQSIALLPGCVGGNQDLSGEDLQFAPEFSWSIDGSYTWELANDFRLKLFGRMYYSDEYQMTADGDPRGIQDAFSKIDASLSLSRADRKWQVSLIGRNLTDEKTANFANDGAGGAGDSFFYFSHPPRSVAVQARLNF